MYWNFTWSLQLDEIEESFDSPAHGKAPKGKNSSSKLPLSPTDLNRETFTISHSAFTLKVFCKTFGGGSSGIYSPRPKPASFVRTRTEVAWAVSLLHDSPLMQPVTRPWAGSLVAELGKEKEKLPLGQEEEGCWRRRPSASLISWSSISSSTGCLLGSFVLAKALENWDPEHRTLPPCHPHTWRPH